MKTCYITDCSLNSQWSTGKQLRLDKMDTPMKPHCTAYHQDQIDFRQIKMIDLPEDCSILNENGVQKEENQQEE